MIGQFLIFKLETNSQTTHLESIHGKVRANRHHPRTALILLFSSRGSRSEIKSAMNPNGGSSLPSVRSRMVSEREM